MMGRRPAITTATVSNALVVTVDALLARAGGGYAVEVAPPGGTRRLVPVSLGLFDDAGMLQHVGVCSSFSDKTRVELVEFLAPYRKNALDSHPWKGWAAT